MKIEAAVSRAKIAPLNFEKLELEEPRHDEVRVRLVATGICHTDMAVRDHTIVPMPQPIVLGHEGAGIVEAVGESVTKVKADDRVILSGNSCGNCPNCQVSMPSYCYEFFPAISAAGVSTAARLSLSTAKKCTRSWGRAHLRPT